MFTAKAPTGPGVSMPDRRSGSHRGLIYLLLTTLAVISVAACQRAPEVTEQWAPPYLEIHLFAGKVQVQGAEGSEWTTMEGKAGFTLEERGQIIADAVEGAQLFLGDGSTLELDPGTILELRNPRTLPRLQVIVQEGGLLFFAQNPSFEFIISARPVTLLSVPSLIRIEVHGEKLPSHIRCDVTYLPCFPLLSDERSGPVLYVKPRQLNGESHPLPHSGVDLISWGQKLLNPGRQIKFK